MLCIMYQKVSKHKTGLEKSYFYVYKCALLSKWLPLKLNNSSWFHGFWHQIIESRQPGDGFKWKSWVDRKLVAGVISRGSGWDDWSVMARFVSQPSS